MAAARSLEGRTALVTGGARGIGRAIVQRLLDEQMAVVALDVIDPESLPDGAHFVRADVTDPDEVQRALKTATDHLSGLDVLVNNAGLLSGRRPFLESSKDELIRYLTVNAVGYVLAAQAAHPWLSRSAAGRIVNVASRTFFTGAPGQLAYVASKGAVLGLTRVMARELGAEGITVNAVMPGQVATPGTEAHSDESVFNATMRQQAIQRRVMPEDLAGLIAFLATDDAGMITGQTIICDGGGYLH
jgi:NAD(P)-dependent dehydrogenase (short-subunit alcohol dehydrogenase family)